MSEFNKDEMIKKFHELKKKGGPITLEDLAGEELIKEATEHHKSFTSPKEEIKDADRELLEKYHKQAVKSHPVVSEIGEFTNSENETCLGFKIKEKLIFFDIQSNCMCADENGFVPIYEIALYEV
jgi:hypothetical protein